MAKRKYKNIKVSYDGLNFDSKKECERYKELKALEQQGRISGLTTQETFVIAKGVKIKGEPRKRPNVKYVADFVYLDKQTGEQVVEDVKSKATAKNPVYRLKKLLMKLVHDIDVVEI